MLTVKLAAERAAVSESLVYQWCQEGRLPHYRMGGSGCRGKILIAKEDFDGFLATLKVSVGASVPADAPPVVTPPRPRLRHVRVKP